MDDSFSTSRRSFITSLLAAAAMPRRIFGASFSATAARAIIGVNGNASPVGIAATRSLGIRYVRDSLYWGNYLDTRQIAADRRTPVASGGRTNAQWFAVDMAAYKAAGLNVLLVIHSPPPSMTLQQGMAELPSFAAARAKEFPGTAWQIMNEMDGEPAFNGGSQDWFHAHDARASQQERGALYGSLLGPVHDAIKAADPTAAVICGGISLEPTAFWRGMMTRTSPRQVDAAAVHCYGIMPNIMVTKSIAMRRVLNGKPLWCTEFGDLSTDEATQAAHIRAALSDDRAHDRFDRAYLYTLLEGGDHYGLVNPNGTLRAAARVVRSMEP
jgi:hypothetical protein